MTTQFVLIDSARWTDFPSSQASAEPSSLGVPPEKHQIGDNDFFKGKSIAELAREQGVGPVTDIGIFAGGIPDDEDVDEMLAEIYRLREP
jgi:hypothetical protein